MASVTDESDLFAAAEPQRTTGQNGRDDPPPASRRVLVAVRAAILAILIGGFAFLLWRVYSDGGDAPAAGPVPILRADPSPVRLDIDPETVPNEGGMTIPFRDMLVMRRSAEAVRPLLDRVVALPAPEDPLPVPGAPGGLAAVRTSEEPEYLLRRMEEAAPLPDLDDTALGTLLEAEDQAVASEPAAAPSPAPATHEDPIAAMLNEQPANPADQIAPLVAAPADEPAPAPPPPDPAPVAVGSHAVQLGALRDAAAAQGEVERLQRRFASLLGQVEIAVLPPPATGGLTRIVAIGFDEQGARELCTGLRQRGGDCFVREAP